MEMLTVVQMMLRHAEQVRGGLMTAMMMQTGVLKGNHERIFMKEIKHVQQGLLSDTPGV